ncbi:MAG: 30S ribosomal protein S4 [Patescibacteria group bacterium]
MADTKCKTCRRVGQKLFLKEERCLSPKCPISRKPYPPGRRAKRMKPLSEYGAQLKEKQKLKFLYGLREKQFVNYVKKAMKKGGENIGLQVIQLLESRLDNIVFRLGLAKSRSSARQMVNHGHICLNGRKLSIPSAYVKKSDKISIRSQSAGKKLFEDLDIHLKKYTPPTWLKLDKVKKEGEILGIPSTDVELDVKPNLIIEYYSR